MSSAPPSQVTKASALHAPAFFLQGFVPIPRATTQSLKVCSFDTLDLASVEEMLLDEKKEKSKK